MNTKSRIGKIARLPHSIRQQLNLKLHDGIPAKSVLVADFDNRPINKQNLSEWKQGGFRDWLLQYQAAQFLQFMDPQSSSSSSSSSSSIPVAPTEIQHSTEQPQALSNSFTHHASRITEPHEPSDLSNSAFSISHSSLTSKLLLWTQLQYITMARSIDAETDPDRKWSALRQFANDISRLRRSSLADDYLQIQRDWLAITQSNTAAKKEQEFWKWTQRPDIEKKLFPNKNGLTPEDLYEMETKFCLMGDGPGPEVAELMAQVRLAKKILQIRKTQEAEARAKAAPDYDPKRPLPDAKVHLAGMPFEELFPTLPEKPLTETQPELDDDPDIDHSNRDSAPPIDKTQTPPVGASPSHPSAPFYPSNPSDSSDKSDQIKPSQTESNQIQPTPPPSDTPI